MNELDTLSEESEDAGINGDYGEEDGGEDGVSSEDERDGEREDGPEDGVSKSPRSDNSRKAAAAEKELSPVVSVSPANSAASGKRDRDESWSMEDSV